jgi:orotate phosphoribosyltransferase
MTLDTASLVARFLLDIEAFAYHPDAPVETASGRRTVVSVDGRKIIAHPRLRRRLVELAVERLAEVAGIEAFDAVAGGETAGLPLAAWLADALMLPMLYVRKQPKGFGRNAAIEGRLAEGARVMLVDDVAVDGTSKLAFADALREAGATVEHVLVVCAAGIWPDAERELREAGLTLHALTTWPDMAKAARQQARLPSDLLDEIDAFMADPDGWAAGASHAGRGGDTLPSG